MSEQPHNACILLVDDHPNNLRILYNTLDGRGYKLLVAGSGRAALTIAANTRPDLVLLDIMMPELDGYAVCEALQNDPATRDSAVIFLSALDETTAKVRGFSLGAVDYITKPFQAAEVIARVNTHVRLRQLEMRLQQRNIQLESENERILASVSEAIITVSPQRGIKTFNRSAMHLFNLSAETVLDQPVAMLFPQLPHLENTLLGRPDAPILANVGELKSVFLNGAQRDLDYSVSPIDDQSGALAAVIVLRDVSQRNQQQRALREAEQALREQRDVLAHASRLQVMGEMAAGFAHEVNQPLTAITNYAGVAERFIEQTPPDLTALTKTLGKIGQQAQRASAIIQRIRSFVKKPESEKQPLQPTDLVHEVIDLAEVDSRRCGVDLKAEVAPGLPRLLADPVQMQQVLLNLARNAMEASQKSQHPGSDVVWIKAFEAQGRVVFQVEDQGQGVPEELVPLLFHPFSSSKSDGMGVGLTVCQSLVKGHGGSIRYEPNQPHGTVFVVELPVHAV